MTIMAGVEVPVINGILAVTEPTAPAVIHTEPSAPDPWEIHSGGHQWANQGGTA